MWYFVSFRGDGMQTLSYLLYYRARFAISSLHIVFANLRKLATACLSSDCIKQNKMILLIQYTWQSQEDCFSKMWNYCFKSVLNSCKLLLPGFM